MIFVRQRGAEQGHDAVAHHLVDGALVVVDRFHHALEHRIQELARLLRVAIGQQLHRAFEVREQHGHLLALALQRSARGQDLLGEMLWGVFLRKGRFVSSEGGDGRTAFQAELGAGRQLGPAARAP